MFVTQTITQQTRDALMGGSTGPHAGIAARAIVEIDKEKVLRFEQSLIKKVVKMESGRNVLLLISGQTR